MINLTNKLRFFHYLSAVLDHQQSDPLCRECKAHVNTVSALGEGLDEMIRLSDDRLNSLPEDLATLHKETRIRLNSLVTSDAAVGQKKAGNCKMPEGVCFIKTSKAILKKI